MLLVRTAVFATMLIISGPASAEWEYTHWGMTAYELIGASGGIAKDVAHVDLDKFSRALSAPHQVMDISLRALFLFDLDTKGLSRIELSPTDKENCPVIRTLVIRKYGAPASESSTDVTRESQWLSTDTKIAMREFPVLGVCNIIYTPANSDDDIGL